MFQVLNECKLTYSQKHQFDARGCRLWKRLATTIESEIVRVTLQLVRFKNWWSLTKISIDAPLSYLLITCFRNVDASLAYNWKDHKTIGYNQKGRTS